MPERAVSPGRALIDDTMPSIGAVSFAAAIRRSYSAIETSADLTSPAAAAPSPPADIVSDCAWRSSSGETAPLCKRRARVVRLALGSSGHRVGAPGFTGRRARADLALFASCARSDAVSSSAIKSPLCTELIGLDEHAQHRTFRLGRDGLRHARHDDRDAVEHLRDRRSLGNDVAHGRVIRARGRLLRRASC